MKILVIDDEPDICEIISITFNLRWPEARVITAGTGHRGLELVAKEKPDVVILDVGLPDMLGFEVCKTIKERSTTPVLILSARNSEADKVKGFEMGADDYIVKPFNHLELLARTKAILRRQNAPALGMADKPYQKGRLRIDFDRRQVTVDGRVVVLPQAEYNLLYHLVKNANRTVTNRTLLAKVWGREYADQTDYLRNHVRGLQSKIEDDPAHPRFIVSERGHGYRFVEPVESAAVR
jgi:two-component system KDP operon response regulator KdpE